LAAARTQYKTGRSNLSAAQELAIATGEQTFILATGKDLPVSSLLGTVQFAALVTNPIPPQGADKPWNPEIIKNAINGILGSSSVEFHHHVTLVPGNVTEPELSWSDRDQHRYGRHFVVKFPSNWTDQQVIAAVFEDTAGLGILKNAAKAEYYHPESNKSDSLYLSKHYAGDPDVFAAGLQGHTSMYKVLPLAKDVQPLLIGTAQGIQQQQPVAWTRVLPGSKSKVFYTSLGDPKDVQQPSVRKLIANGIEWALKK
jgi:hypothetical protein